MRPWQWGQRERGYPLWTSASTLRWRSRKPSACLVARGPCRIRSGHAGTWNRRDSSAHRLSGMDGYEVAHLIRFSRMRASRSSCRPATGGTTTGCHRCSPAPCEACGLSDLVDTDLPARPQAQRHPDLAATEHSSVEPHDGLPRKYVRAERRSCAYSPNLRARSIAGAACGLLQQSIEVPDPGSAAITP